MNTHGHTVEEWRALCRKYQQTYRLKHPEKMREKYRKYRYRKGPTEAQKEVKRAKGRAYYHAHKTESKLYYQQNRDKIVARVGAYSKKNRDKISAYHKAYYQTNGDVMRARGREYSKKHQKENLERLRQWNKRHPDRRKALLQKWRGRNPEKVLIQAARRRARIRGVTVVGDESKIEQWMARLRRLGTLCYYCQSPIRGGQINFDHIVAIARGGPNCRENLCASCKSCNSRKHVKSISEWSKLGQQLFAV